MARYNLLTEIFNHNFTTESLEYPGWTRITRVLLHPLEQQHSLGLMPRPENVLGACFTVTQEEFRSFLFRSQVQVTL